MQISEKLKLFSWFFIAFLESPLNFEHFQRKNSFKVQVSLKVMTAKKVLTQMNKRSCFWKLFGRERVNESLKLPKTAEKHFYTFFS